jgi:signal transduction histidine kinase
MTLLAIVVIVSWLWMMTTALHLDDARTESPHIPASLSVGRVRC